MKVEGRRSYLKQDKVVYLSQYAVRGLRDSDPEQRRLLDDFNNSIKGLDTDKLINEFWKELFAPFKHLYELKFTSAARCAIPAGGVEGFVKFEKEPNEDNIQFAKRALAFQEFVKRRMKEYNIDEFAAQKIFQNGEICMRFGFPIRQSKKYFK